MFSISPKHDTGVGYAPTDHFHIDLHGSHIPGLCSGLAVATEDLGGPLPEGRYPLIDVLATSGIRGLYAYARRNTATPPGATPT